MSEWINKCHFGDVRDVLRQMIDAGVKVNCIVTSPPYWGLRSYLPADHPDKAREIGSEPTLREFIVTMTDVFMLAREVLADDGTLFLNMGDSYFGGGRGGGSEGSKQRTNAGSLIKTQKWSSVNGEHVQHAAPCDTSDKAPANSQARDCLCGNLCDACRRAYRIGKSRNGSEHAPMPTLSPLASSRAHTGARPDHPPTLDSTLPAGRTFASKPDLEQVHQPFPAEQRGVLVSTSPESSLIPLAECLPEPAQDEECQLCGCSLQGCVPVSVRMAGCNCDTDLIESAIGTSGMGFSSLASHIEPQRPIKAKDLMGQPWRLAFALQDAGWWLRQDIIWSKPNPMPESVRDRCTKAHEYLFLMTKSERYWWDFEAMQEPVNGGANPRRAGPNAMRGQGSNRPEGGGRANREGRDMATVGHEKGRVPGNVNPPKGQAAYEAGDDMHRTKAGLLAYAQKARKLADPGSGTKNNDSMDEALSEMRETRNRRSVWTVPSEPYSGAHFATFPSALIEPCILAGCPAGGVVLDIFMGSGTTGAVAKRLGRNWIGIDIDERNAALQRDRISPQESFVLEAA